MKEGARQSWRDQPVRVRPSERNMSNPAMRGIVVLPGSRATSRAQGSRRNLGALVSDHRPCADLVRIGKARSRSR